MSRSERTLELLDTLDAYGFTNEDFRVVHHQAGITIKAHRKYCGEPGNFDAARPTNIEVMKRLELMVGALQGGGFKKPANPGALRALAEAAVMEIPK